MPGLWYTIVISGEGGGITRNTEVNLLVGGARIFLPIISRGMIPRPLSMIQVDVKNTRERNHDYSQMPNAR